MDSVAMVQFWDLVEKMIKLKKADLLKWCVYSNEIRDGTFHYVPTVAGTLLSTQLEYYLMEVSFGGLVV